jgi:hypothetical protein
MATITDIYKQYRIFNALQLHQLRVAAVAQIVAENIGNAVDTHMCVTFGLLHDMGNLAKAKFEQLPDLWEPEGVEYWKAAQKEVRERYNVNDTLATIAMLAEIGAPDEVIRIVRLLKLDKAPLLRDTGTFEEKICQYADMRVGPYGILSVDERFADGRKRYPFAAQRPPEETAAIVRAIKDIESELFARSTITPLDITNDMIAPIMEELRVLELVVK